MSIEPPTFSSTHPSRTGPLPPGGGGPGSRGPRSQRAKPRPGAAPRPFFDAPSGFRGWWQRIPGKRGIVTPCVDGGRVLVGGGFGSHEFYAFDARTGALLWERRTRDDGPTAAVAAEGRVAFNTESCTVCVLDAATGEPVWERWLGDPLLAQPALGGGRLFMAWPARPDHLLGAFDLADGRPLWQVRLEADVITAPVFAEGALYASTFDGSVHAFDAATGASQWTRALRATSAPWVWKGEVFVSQREERPDAEKEAGGPGEAGRARRGAGAGAAPWERVAAVRAARLRALGELKRAAYLRSRRGTAAEREDRSRDAAVGFGVAPGSAKLYLAEALLGATTVSRAWSFQGSRPCVWNDLVYSVAGDELTAASVADGRERWRWKAGYDPGEERALTPPAVANGRVWIATREGRVCSFDARTGERRWAIDLNAPVAWQPVVAGGQVFAGTADGRLVAFATEDPADDGWPMWGGGPGHNG